MNQISKPTTLHDLLATGWQSRSIKDEVRSNFIRCMAQQEEMFPGMVGYENTVIPEISIAMLAGHDMLFLGEKGQGKSRLMRSLVRFLDPEIPYLNIPDSPVKEDPLKPITSAGKRLIQNTDPKDIPIAWWARKDRYAERLAPGTKFADIIGELDPAKLAAGTSMSLEESLHFGLIPRMHRGIFAMNEIPELDELIQVGLFNILEERDVQIRGYPIQFDLDILILFSANPATYNRSGKVIPQLKDRIGSLIQTHYPKDRDLGIQIMVQESHLDLEGEYPVHVPYFMQQVIEQITICARKSKYVDHQSGVSARFSLANYRTMVASARRRGILHQEKPAVPRISDLGHLPTSSLGKLELDLMGTTQMSENQVLEAIIAEAIANVFEEYVESHGLEAISELFSKGVKVEVGDTLPSASYVERLKKVPQAWEKAFELNRADHPGMRAACVEFVLAGLYATDRISRSTRHGNMFYQI
ncbi:MAG: magnesium chelatase [Zavarzinella sp.]